MLGLPSATPFAQADVAARVERTRVAIFDADHADVRTVLRRLFDENLFGVTLAPDVCGTVTLSLRDVPFEEALRAVLLQAGAWYRLDRGWFEISALRDHGVDAVWLATPDPGLARIEAAYAAIASDVARGRGAALRANLLPGFGVRDGAGTKRGDPAARSVAEVVRAYPRFSIERVARWEPKPSGRAEVVTAYARPDAPTAYFRDDWRETPEGWRLAFRERTAASALRRFEATPVSEILRAIGEREPFDWTLDGTLDRPVSLDLTGLTFKAALALIMGEVGGGYRIERGTYRFVSLLHGPIDASATIVSTVDFDRTDVRRALAWLGERVGANVSIAPNVNGTVTLHLRNAVWETAFQAALRQVGATYRSGGGILDVVRVESSKP